MKKSINEYVGDQIREHRKRTGLSQEQLASLIKVPANTLSRWETAIYKPKLKDLDGLAKALGVSVSSFFPADEPTEHVAALMRKAKDLPQPDIDALIEFADFKRAQHLLKKG